MTAARRRSRSKRLATLLGATCLALVAIPATASAHITGTFGPDPNTNAITLALNSHDEGETIALGCSPGGKITLNGSEFTLGGPTINCGGSNGPQAIAVNGGGGNDTIDFAGVSEATGFTRIREFCDVRFVCQNSVFAEAGPGRDTMTGGPFGERFNGLFAFEYGEGADTIHGNGGNDDIKGTNEADKLFGGAGSELIEPGPGDDVAHGDPGEDYFVEVKFHNDRDRFFGEGGRDFIVAGGGGDFLDGGPGGDSMDGLKGRDRIFGRAGNDFIRGGPGRDKLRGGPGKDTVIQGGKSPFG